MLKTRLLAFPLTLALALAGASAVMAQEDTDADDGSTAAFDLSSIPEANQDEALILFHQLQEKLVAAGVSEGDVGAAVDALEAEYGNLSEADMDELLAAQMMAEGDDEFGQAEEDEPGDDEFGQAEEDEPELGDDDEDEDEDED